MKHALAGIFVFGALTITPLAFSRLSSGEATAAKTVVRVLRTPDGGIQPQAVADNGIVHLIYFKGEPRAGSVYYVQSGLSEIDWSEPLRVNDRPASVIATGTVRGAHLAVGKNGRVHVAWMGAADAEPEGPGGAAPMLYARLNDRRTGFEPQRNVMQFAYGLDGGGSVAADGLGNVYVAWHARGDEGGEEHRRVWLAQSSDEGATFSSEIAVSPSTTGACGCCGMRAIADPTGAVYVMYRTAADGVDRGMRLLVKRNAGASFTGIRLDEWKLSSCPMTTTSIHRGGGRVLAAWENKEQVYFAAIGSRTDRAAIPAPGNGKRRKHPVAVGNEDGEILLVWTEGTGWNQGGSLAWQIFNARGEPTEERGTAPDVPVWSLPTAFADAHGSFTIIY